MLMLWLRYAKSDRSIGGSVDFVAGWKRKMAAERSDGS
jgi:hypothetical protein